MWLTSTEKGSIPVLRIHGVRVEFIGVLRHMQQYFSHM